MWSHPDYASNGKSSRLVQEHRSKDTLREADPLSVYLNQISKYPLLTAEQEKTLGAKLDELKKAVHETDEIIVNNPFDENAKLRHAALLPEISATREKLIAANLRLVVSVARGYQQRGINLLDLIDEGNIGLIEAVNRFDYQRGYRFSTYASWWIRQAIIKCLVDQSRVIRLPIHMLNTIRRCYAAAKELVQELGRDPSFSEVAEKSGISRRKVESAMQFAIGASSLDSSLDEEKNSTLVDNVRDEKTLDPFSQAFTATLQDLLRYIMCSLSQREQIVLQMRYGLNGEGPRTLEETGKALGITRERVRQIQEQAMEKIKKRQELSDCTK